MNLKDLKKDCAQKQQKGIHFIIASVVIWIMVLIVQLTDLQSAPFGHSGTHPCRFFKRVLVYHSIRKKSSVFSFLGKVECGNFPGRRIRRSK